MDSALRNILACKREEVRALRRKGFAQVPGNRPLSCRDFRGAITAPGAVNLIGEIKFASPSAGPIRDGQDPVPIGRLYEGAGVAAISLLTDKRFFGGDIRNLPRLKRAVTLPILRKDFILDEIQVRESLFYGADGVLLIARILSADRLKRLWEACREAGIGALTEVHDEQDLEKAVSCGADIIGINNRDLDTLTVDLETTRRLAPKVPPGHVLVSESGIRNKEDIRSLSHLGVRAVLVGTALMRSQNPGEKAKELAGKGRRDGKGKDLRHHQS